MPIPIANTSVDDVPRRDVTPEKLAKLDKEIDRGRIEIVSFSLTLPFITTNNQQWRPESAARRIKRLIRSNRLALL